MTIQEFFGTLQESVTAAWRKHLQTDKYSTHMALDEFYTEMPEKVDALIEAWQADHDVVEDYTCVLDAKEFDSIGYLKELKRITKEGRELMDSSELESLCDDVLGQIDSTLYKLQHLKEGLASLAGFLNESMSQAVFEDAAGDNAVFKINSTRKPKGGKVVADTWGQPVKVGDYVIGVGERKPYTKNDSNYQSDNNLIVGRIAELYPGGMYVTVLGPNDLDSSKSTQASYILQKAKSFGGVPMALKVKCGFVKVDPKLLPKIFGV